MTCESDGCDREAVRTDVPLCAECWLALSDFLRDVEADPELVERPRLEVER